jgi:hypothetical protein
MTEPTLMIRNNSLTYGVKLTRRMSDKILKAVDEREIPQ